MRNELCLGQFCFFRLAATDPKFFGFAEYLAGLALMVLVWTVAEPRYRFRIRTAAIPLQGITFAVVSTVGVLTLLTDVWRAEQWYVPRGAVLTPALWQGVMGGALLLTFLVWTWFAFMRPPVFGFANASRFEAAVYYSVLRGIDTELSVVADELAASVPALVRMAPTKSEIHVSQKAGKKLSRASVSAHQIFLLFADPRFVRALVSSSPHTALSLFRCMADSKRYSPALSTFSVNFVEESISNKHSYLYHEAEGYDTGLIGYQKPLTSAMFGSYEMVEGLDRMLDADYRKSHRWDSEQLEAFTRVTLIVLHAYVTQVGIGTHSYVLYRAVSEIWGTQSSVSKLDGVEMSAWDDDTAAKLRVCVDFTKKAVEIVATVPVPSGRPIRERDKGNHRRDIYRLLATLCFELIFAASSVRAPRWTCWWIQHNTVWGELFNFNSLDSPAGKLIKHILRRMIYDEIREMDRFPNYKGAKLIGLLLNVLGRGSRPDRHDRDSLALQTANIRWVKRSFALLYATRPDIAAHCLVDGMTYDASRKRILFSGHGHLGDNKPRIQYLQLD